MPFKDISYLELWGTFCSADQTICAILVGGYQDEQFCEIILNLDQWFRRCVLKIHVFLNLSFGGPFVRLSGTICAILVKGITDFLSAALAALMFSGADSFMQFWKRASWGTFMWSYMKFRPVVQEMSFKERFYGLRKTDEGWTKTDHNTSPWAFGSGGLKTL